MAENHVLSVERPTAHRRWQQLGFLSASALGLLVYGCFSQHQQQQQQQETISTETNPIATENERDLADAFIYSKMATVVPDPNHPISDKVKQQVKDTWGYWHFWDGDESTRPTDDYCGKFPNRDITEFPDTAWQNDAVFVNHLLDDGEHLVERTMEAILTEYGWGQSQFSQDKRTWALSERLKMYEWDKVPNLEADDSVEPAKYKKTWSTGGGGWTTEKSVQGLVRRLLHAMMTNDEFVVVMGGHSAAAGHGNHFRQSYMMQFHRVMAPVFARFGVKLVTRNLAQGGLGTVQSAMGMKSIYGDGIDILLWDSGMTESNNEDIEYFMRQALISGKKVPLLWGGPFEVLKKMYKYTDADVGFIGTGMDGIPTTTDEAQSKKLPYAARNMKCAKNHNELCQQDRFCATCWIDREDVPRGTFEKIGDKVPSQVRWHSGWRSHQLHGRLMALTVLDALQVAIQIWSDGTTGGPPLDEDQWHVTEYYENIRKKAMAFSPDDGYCNNLEPRLPKRLCNTAMEARTLYTPRANPEQTSLLTVIKGPEEFKPKQEKKVMYEGEDVHNQCFDTPEGEVDVLAVSSTGARRHLVSVAEPTELQRTVAVDEMQQPSNSHRVLGNEEIALGKGWAHNMEYPGQCDGTYDATCARHQTDECPMLGHQDSRGYVAGNEFSGWMVMEVPKIKEGLIMVNLLTYGHTGAAQNWTTVNNEGRQLRSEPRAGKDVENTNDQVSDGDYIDGLVPDEQRRRLSLDKWPETFEFDFAINGKITTYNKEQFKDNFRQVQRVVQVMILLDDPNFGEKENVEVAYRMRGCGTECTLGVSHIYWA